MRRPSWLKRRDADSRPESPAGRVRDVYFSFDFERDLWRARRVRAIWTRRPRCTAAGFFDESPETIAKARGDPAIKQIINAGMRAAAVTCVLIGRETYKQRWIDYEIFRSVERGMGVFGVRIHAMRTPKGETDKAGPNPFLYLGYALSHDGILLPHVRLKSGWQYEPSAAPIRPGAAPYLMPGKRPILEDLFAVHDWIKDAGEINFPAWVAAAAAQAGR